MPLNDNVEPDFTDKEVNDNSVNALIEADRDDIQFLREYFDTYGLNYYGSDWRKLTDEEKFGLIEHFYRDSDNPLHRIIHTYFANQTTGRIFDILEELIATNVDFAKAFEMLKLNSLVDTVKFFGNIIQENSEN